MKPSHLHKLLRQQAEWALRDYAEQLIEGLVLYNGEDRVYFTGGLRSAFNRATYDALRAQDTENGQVSYAFTHPSAPPMIAYHSGAIANYTDVLPIEDVVAFIFNHELGHIVLGPVNHVDVRQLVRESASDAFGFLRAVQQGADAKRLYDFMVEQRCFGAAFHGNSDYLTIHSLHEAYKKVQQIDIRVMPAEDLAWMAMGIAEDCTPSRRDIKALERVFRPLFLSADTFAEDVESLVTVARLTSTNQIIKDLIDYALNSLSDNVMFDAQGVSIVDRHPAVRQTLDLYQSAKAQLAGDQPKAFSSSGKSVNRSPTKP